ncbi:MAG: amidohydrolase family protein [Acidimicrobiales bacterium]
MRTAIENIGTIVSGRWQEPFLVGDTIVTDEGRIEAVGTGLDVGGCDVVIDAGGATVIPGLIDSHVHVAFGDFTPRQNTVGYLESYLHGGTTTALSAAEVHVPGRPKDTQGVKALAVAAHKCFENFRPGGMRVHAGSLILEPGLTRQDFDDVKADGVWLSKAGFGAVDSAADYVELVAMARDAGLMTTLHTGGCSIPGTFPVTGQDVLDINPHISFHINGGPVAIADEYFEPIARDTDIGMQVCAAGNLRTAILAAEMAKRHDAFDRLLIGTDTPTGSGIMPLGMLYTITHIAALSDLDVVDLISAATGNVARIYGLDNGLVSAGRDADLVVIDAPEGGTKDTALAAMTNGDVCAIGAVMTNGEPRFVGRSRNTPPTSRPVTVSHSTVLRQF